MSNQWNDDIPGPIAPPGRAAPDSERYLLTPGTPPQPLPVDRGDFGHPVAERVQYPPMYQRPQVAPKSPAVACLASAFIPGLGSLIIGRVGIGVLIFFAYVVSWMLLFVAVGFLTLPAVWVWGMVDAYKGAKKWNAAHGIIS